MTFGGPPPSSPRGALLWPIEGNRWILGLGGRHGDAPPGDFDGFMAFTRGLRTPTIYNAVKNARLDGEIVRFGFRDNVLRHFERMEVFPRGLIPIGDSICRFNPVYGQGMSVAAQEPACCAIFWPPRLLRAVPCTGWPRFFRKDPGADRDALERGDLRLHSPGDARAATGGF